jgi:hypothetical protein
MAIKKFEDYIISEASAADLVNRKPKEEVDTGKPRAEGEKEFADAHDVVVHDYPADVEAQFKGTITTAVSGGESEPVQQGSSMVKEEVESLEEGKVLDQLEKIVKTKGASKVKFANGKSVTVDMTSANALVNMMKKLNDKNAAKASEMLEKSPEDMLKLLDVAFGGKK